MPRTFCADPVLDRSVLLVEDRRTLLHVELEDVAGRKPEPKSDGDDASRGGAGDQIEVAADRMFEMLFESRQETRPEKRRGCRRHRATGCERTCRRSARRPQIRSCGFLIVVVISWMHAPALPIVGSEPLLEVEQPERRPWHDGLVEPHPRLPFVVCGRYRQSLGGFC